MRDLTRIYFISLLIEFQTSLKLFSASLQKSRKAASKTRIDVMQMKFFWLNMKKKQANGRKPPINESFLTNPVFKVKLKNVN